MSQDPLNPYTAEHEMLRENFRKFLQKEVTPYVDEWEKNKVCSREVFTKMGENGFFGVSFPEEVGGSGMDLWSACVIAEELAWVNCGGLAMSLYAHTYLPLPLINALGTEQQKQEYLIPALRGEKVAALAITEPNAGSDVAGIQTTAKDMGDHYLVNGSKMYITNGTMADFIVLVTRSGEGLDFTILLFDTRTPGFSANKMDWKLGMHTSDTGHLFFDNCKVPKSAVIGQAGMGFYYIMNNLQEERLIGAVSAAFGAEAALERAKKFARERSAFGKPIAKLQVIRHKLAQMAIKVETAKSISYQAVREFLVHGSGAVKTISIAKCYATEAANEVIDMALQVHGGAGYMEEYGIARSWRDLRLMTVGAGTTEIMHEIISKLVVDEVNHRVQVIKARA